MDNVAQLKEALATASRIIANEGLASGFGHISVRIPDTDRFLIPGSVSPALVTPEDIVTFDLAGKKVEGEKKPVSETWIHTCIYRARSDVVCVSHFHPPFATILAAAGREINPVHNFGSVFPEGIRLFIKPGLINTEQLGTEMADALGQNNALLLRGHGVVVVGSDIADACLCTIYLEEAAQIQYHASLLGSPLPFFTVEEATLIKSQVHGRLAIDRAWEYYVQRLSVASPAPPLESAHGLLSPGPPGLLLGD